MMYELTTNYGGALFSDETDALNALFLLYSYEFPDKGFDKCEVQKNLKESGRWDEFPLSLCVS
ncbi:hypothetical protein [Ruminococcus gauvreauii]|uniref:hypothetical protein n=1 Tax=Ruminococcus gauvreauii TaxID=438033 RepID=UPI0039845E99